MELNLIYESLSRDSLILSMDSFLILSEDSLSLSSEESLNLKSAILK